jgi:hypothetical protein
VLRKKMSKKNALDPREVQQTIADYKQAFLQVRGEYRLRELTIFYKKGWFYLSLEGRHPSPYSHKEILRFIREGI